MSSLAKCCRLADPAPLEDDITYVWRKAMRGHGLDAAGLAEKCGVEKSAIDALLSGQAPPHVLENAAMVLHLHPDALKKHASYRPGVPHLHAVTRLQLPFESDAVNAWLIREDDHTLLFDTGFERDSVRQILQPLGTSDIHLFLTHDHRDHVGGVNALRPSIKKHHEMSYGQVTRLGALTITCLDLSGHCIPTYGYLITGLSRNVCVVGDALFAGSIGGCTDPFTYQMALRNLRHHVLSLHDDVILLPGHGPATTVGQEKRGNPFLASSV
jgi:hydroxyacylglutathione hydrolase